MMKTLIRMLSLAGLALFAGCQRLDMNMYNLSEDLTEYKMDNYTGEQDFVLDPSYTIPDSLVHLFTLQSKAPGEETATKIYAIYIGSLSQIATDTVIMYCHGNKWHMDFYWQRAKLLAHTGGKNRFGVLMIDYRGFGLSEGEPTEDGLYADVDAGLQWLKDRGLGNSRLVMYGFSLGSAPATELTAHPRSLAPAKLILEAPFASTDVMAADGTQLNMPGSYFTNLGVDNAEEIKQVQQPLYWMHGSSDLFLNYRTHGQVVYDNHAGAWKQFRLVENADHGQVPAFYGFSRYNDDLLQFIIHP